MGIVGPGIAGYSRLQTVCLFVELDGHYLLGVWLCPRRGRSPVGLAGIVGVVELGLLGLGLAAGRGKNRANVGSGGGGAQEREEEGGVS